jgi:hypothetical protein
VMSSIMSATSLSRRGLITETYKVIVVKKILS